jgi:hypothetical protein
MRIRLLPHRRRWLSAAALLLLPLATHAQSQENFYVDFQLQSGIPSSTETIVGNITLAPGTTGVVPGSAITGYSFSSTPGDPVTFSTSGSSPSVVVGPGLFTIQGNDLLFTPLPWVPSPLCATCDNNPYQALAFGTYQSTYLDFQGPGLQGIPFEHGAAGPTPSGLGVVVGGFQGGGWILAPGTVIGTNRVPEINSEGALPAFTLLAGMLVMLRGRHRPLRE